MEMMDKLQQHIDDILEAAGHGLEKRAVNPFTGPDKTRPGLRPKNSNSSDTSVMSQGKGYKSEDLNDYKTVEGRGGKPQDITQVYSDHAMKTVTASSYDLRSRMNSSLQKQAAKASGFSHPIQATCAFTGADAADMVKMAGVLDAIVRRLPVEKVIPYLERARGAMGGGRIGSALGNLEHYLKARGMESVMAGPMVSSANLAQMKAESEALRQFMMNPAPSPLPGLGLAAALGALGGGAAVHKLHEPHFRHNMAPIIYQGEVGDDRHQPE